MQAFAAMAQWQPVWSDEFDVEGMPDSSRWGYEEGLVRNKEKQFYTVGRPQNARIELGYLILEARKENYANRLYQPGSNDWRYMDDSAFYTSASLITLGKQSFQYGKMEVRAKVPSGLGMWPAIWLVGTNRPQVGWPACGEIDLMEFVGHDSMHVYGTIHYPDPTGQKTSVSNGGKVYFPKPFFDFHVYGLEWTPDSLHFKLDGLTYHSAPIEATTKNGDNLFRKPFYLILNLAVGGTWGGPVDDANLPKAFMIDYVRYYKRTE
jgi:beta-glucanase (GH16 family)